MVPKVGHFTCVYGWFWPIFTDLPTSMGPKNGKNSKNHQKNKNEKQNVPILKVQRVEQNHYTYMHSISNK